MQRAPLHPGSDCVSCPQGLLLRQLYHVPQVCPAHLAKAVTLPGAWSGPGRLERRAPLPGLSDNHPAGQCESQGVSCALETPRVQPMDLPPLQAAPQGLSPSGTCWASGLRLAVSWGCRCEGRNVPLPHCGAPWGRELRGHLVSPKGPPWKRWRASGESPARPKGAGCVHPASSQGVFWPFLARPPEVSRVG